MLRRAAHALPRCAQPSTVMQRCLRRSSSSYPSRSSTTPLLLRHAPLSGRVLPSLSKHFVRCFADSTPANASATPVAPRKCTGCGVKLQTEKENARGFVPLVKFETTVGDIVCYRCWGMRHHNMLTKPEVHDIGVIEKALKDKKCTLVKIVDILDVHGSIIPNFSRLAAGLPVVVVGNKFDLMPNGAKADRIRQWLRTELQKEGLSPAQVIDYVLLSSKTGEGFTALKTLLRDLATSNELFVVGSTNVGKSSFINRLMDRIERRSAGLTVSHFPGTTLDIVSFPLNSGATVHDTPGVQNHNHIVPLLSVSELNLVLPKKCLQPVTYRLLPGKTIFLGGLARLDVISTSSAFCYVTFFASSDLVLAIHATRTERASALYQNHLGTLLQPPSKFKEGSTKPRDFPPLEPHRFTVNGNSWTKAECDITLGGIGWASVTVDGEAVIDVHLPYPVKPRQTTPLMPFELADRSKRRIRKHGKMRQGASEGDIEKEVSEAKDLEKVLLEDDVVKSRAEEPLTLKRWKPR